MDADIELTRLDAPGFVAATPAPGPALLGPALAAGSLTIIRGPRGVGKSWLALAMAHAVAGGTALLGWAGAGLPTIYVDGAMSRTRLAARARAHPPLSGRLAFVPGGIDGPPDLGEPEFRRDIERFLEGGPALLVLDGLPLLVPPGRAMAERWDGFARWLRRLREAGHAVLLVDAAPRRTLVELADTLIALRPDIAADAPTDRLPFAASIATRDPIAPGDRAFAGELAMVGGAAQWSRTAIIDPTLRTIADRAGQGDTVRDIGAALGTSPATVSRRLAQAKALGLVDDKSRETNETKNARISLPQLAAKPCETDETRRVPDDKPRETSETPPTEALRRASNDVLRRTLELRLRHRGQPGQPPSGPPALAPYADDVVLRELAGRVSAARAERLRRHFAPLLAEAPRRAA